MQNLVRQEVIQSARTVIVKVGTNVLSNDQAQLNVDRIAELSEQLHRIRETGRHVVLVSSGAVGAGMEVLGLTQRPTDLPRLQAAAAAGQANLIRLYDEHFRRHGFHAAQILLTANVFKDRDRYLNVRNTIRTLFEFAIVPVINENDSVSVHEITLGDNDRLAAMTAHLVPDPLLVILSNVDGLFDGNPGDNEAKFIPLVEKWDDSVLNFVGSEKTSLGRGGMHSKLQAVRAATAAGENVIIANGNEAGVLDRIMAAEEVGTLFLAQGGTVTAWKRWIGFTVEPKGRLLVDDGARRAVASGGKSLLPVGITAVDGNFGRGEVVSIVDSADREFARGLTNYAADDVRKIAGSRGESVGNELGHMPHVEVVHRDNLVVTQAD